MAIVEALSIQGGIPLRGTVAASGGKNAAVAILPAALLASSPCTIVSVITDIGVPLARDKPLAP